MADYFTREITQRLTNGSWAQVGAFAGNACVVYARPNVYNGQKTMWEKPWTSRDLETCAWIDNVSLSQIDCL